MARVRHEDGENGKRRRGPRGSADREVSPQAQPEDRAQERPRGTVAGAGGSRARALTTTGPHAAATASRVDLRPHTFDEYVGQTALVDKLRVYVRAAVQRGDALDHLLLFGPPGLGKTTLAQIVAHEMGVHLHISSGPAIEHRGALGGLLTGLRPRDVLFIDEIHRLSPTIEEILYSAMEDGRLDMAATEGGRSTTMAFELPPFTLIGATTRTALLSAPLRDRFQILEGLELYDDADLARIVARAAGRLGTDITADGAEEIGRRSRGTPRIAIRLTKRVRDFVQVEGRDRIDAKRAASALERQGIDEAGLDRDDRRIIRAIAELFEGGPVGVDSLGASLGIPRDTLEDVHEPFLLQRGFLVRSPRGRMITRRAAEHVGVPYRSQPSMQLSLVPDSAPADGDDA